MKRVVTLMDNEKIVEKLKFTFNLTGLIRLKMQKFVDEHYASFSGHDTPKSQIYSLNDFWYRGDDDLLNKHIEEWFVQSGLNVINLCDDESKSLDQFIQRSTSFKNRRYQYQLEGKDGAGVIDKTTQEFFPAEIGEHWQVIMKIMKENYREILGEESAHIYKKGLSHIDEFILTNFVLLGSRINEQNVTDYSEMINKYSRSDCFEYSWER